MGKKATITVHPGFAIGEISNQLFSAFLEPIGTMVNGTMYNPKHPTADEQGFRTDVINALKATGLPAVRLPGGNFVSAWQWKDSIGPKEQRKEHLDLAWHQYYPNDVGHDEYLQWAEKVGIEPMYTINLGTGDINDAVYNVEYTNHAGGTYWSDLRKKYGHEKPYGVKVWYLGNEMDGPWQVASWEKDPTGYGVLANETSKAMKWVDGSIETAVCVSSSPDLMHFPEWDLKVLQECYNAVDYISMHHYQSTEIGNYAQYMAASRYFEDYIRTEIGLCDYVQQLMRSPKVMKLSLDEYGVFPMAKKDLHFGREVYAQAGTHYRFDPEREYIRHDPDNMPSRSFPPMDPMLMALGNAGVMLEMMRHADRVKIGCMTSGLGVAAGCDHDHVFTVPAYYTYADLIKYGHGISLRTAVECEKYDLESYALDDTHKYHEQDGVDFIDSAAAYDPEAGTLNVFVINRDWEDVADFTLDITGLNGMRFDGHREMFCEDRTPKQEIDPNLVPVEAKDTVCKDMKVTAELKPLSWNVFRFVRA
ncbi:MAG: alpha-L-arabinofuranosidase [Lachnospiraceae bacterium]|nr:alpha-L-arabinofuranosidase [Lachnospiraceae bacterium]